jgi:hypothetical protein
MGAVSTPEPHEFAGGVKRPPKQKKEEAWGDTGEPPETVKEDKPRRGT